MVDELDASARTASALADEIDRLCDDRVAGEAAVITAVLFCAARRISRGAHNQGAAARMTVMAASHLGGLVAFMETQRQAAMKG